MIIAVIVLSLVIVASVAWTSFTDASAPSDQSTASGEGAGPSAGASGLASASPSAASSTGSSAAALASASASPSASPSASATASLSASPSASPPQTVASARAPSAAQADLAIDSFNNAFYKETSRGGRYRLSLSSGDFVPFWQSAELIEMVEDAYARTRRSVYRRMVIALHRGMVHRYGTDWTADREFNDDVMWMVIASIRAYDITHRRAYLDMARRNFARTYSRAWSSDFDGGLWWTTDRHEKNACVNSPASIAAALLYSRTGKASYLRKAERLYAWVRSHLYEAPSGRVNDNLYRGADGSTVVDYSTYSYNQGTFIGAADLLYRVTKQQSYRTDAVNAIQFARNSLTNGGVLRDDGSGDGGGFKGIFMRYAVTFTQRQQIGDFDDWFRQNAAAAWSKRDSRGLMGHDWMNRASDTRLVSFDASAGVVALQMVAR